MQHSMHACIEKIENNKLLLLASRYEDVAAAYYEALLLCAASIMMHANNQTIQTMHLMRNPYD